MKMPHCHPAQASATPIKEITLSNTTHHSASTTTPPLQEIVADLSPLHRLYPVIAPTPNSLNQQSTPCRSPVCFSAANPIDNSHQTKGAVNPIHRLNRSERSPSISFPEILARAERASTVYEDSDTIMRRYPETEHIGHLNDKGLQYFIERVPANNSQIITIRGTHNLKNSLQDLEYQLEYDDRLAIYAHAGFSHDAKQILDNLIDNHLIDEDKPIAVTGHSLGGAIANLLLCHLNKSGYTTLPSTTFAQPKVTNRAGRAAFKDIELTRVVYDEDIVPFLPPTTPMPTWHGPYTQMGSEIILLDDNCYCYLDQFDASRLSVNSFWKNILHETITDHEIGHYIESLKQKQLNPQQITYQERAQHIHPPPQSSVGCTIL